MENLANVTSCANACGDIGEHRGRPGDGLAAPLTSGPGAALVGTPGAPSLTWSIVGEFVLVALAVALVATQLPSRLRTSRESAVRSLADAARPPRGRAPPDRRVSTTGGAARLRASVGRPAAAVRTPELAQHHGDGDRDRHRAAQCQCALPTPTCMHIL